MTFRISRNTMSWQEFGVPVHITLAEESEHVKAATALPFKPAIVIE